MSPYEPLIILTKLCLVMIALGASGAILANPLKSFFERTLFRSEHADSAKDRAKQP
jgi:hypothetical protein